MSTLAARARETYALRRNALLQELERLVGRGGGPVPAVVRAGGSDQRRRVRAADAVRLASDFAVVLGESEATYGE